MLRRRKKSLRLGPGMAQSPGPDLTVVLMGRSGVGKSASADRLMASLTLVDRRIILIGLSGGGRSSAGNTILGSERFPTGCGFEPVPAEVVSGSAAVEDCWLTVVDTPGFTARDSDEDQLEKRLRMIIKQSDPGPHAVVFVVRIGRMSREDSALLAALRDMFSVCSCNYSMVLFTHGDELRGRSIDQMIQSNSCVSELVSMSRGRFCVFDNNQKGNRKQVREFLRHVENIISENRGEHVNLDVRSTGMNWLSEEREKMERRHMCMHRHEGLPMWIYVQMMPRTTVEICCGCFCSTISRLDKLFKELNV